MAGTTSWIISNLLSSLGRLSFTSSSFIAGEVTAGEAKSIHERLMEDLSRLSRMLRRIQAVLHDAEEREIYDKAIQLWLSELREVSYDVEDVLDKHDYQVLKTQVEGMATIVETKPSLKRKKVDDGDDYINGCQVSPSSSTSIKTPNYQVVKTRVEGMTIIVEAEPFLKRKQVCDDGGDYDDYFHGCQVSPSSSSSIKIPISHNMAEKIIKIIEKFDEIAKDRKALQLREEDAPRRLHLDDAMKRPPTSSLVNDSDIFGRKDEKEKIIHLLTSDTEEENTIIPIVGLGGVGKTTLAQLVYNDPIVCKHFSPKVWVSVCEEFDVLRVTKEIVKSIIKSSIHDDNGNLNDIQCILKEALLKKRFLLILDDVWNERMDIWEAFRAPFSGVGMGKIIVTTRSMSVARIMQTVPPHELQCLDLEKSWLLFQRHAFYGWELHQQLNFEQIGREITKKCDGLPLALKAIGGFLRYEVREKVWNDVLNNNLWELEETKNLILPALRISYNHMPGHLKSCFVYASLIPKDCEFEKEELMRMWIAQGYIQCRGRKRSLEDIASEYFEDLQRRSFFQLSRYGTHFTLHDMIHDLARSITKNEICSLTNFDELKKIPTDAKHIFTDYANIFRFHLFRAAIRTFFGVYNYFHFDPNQLRQHIVFEDSFPHFCSLRVLRLGAANFECSLQFLDLIDKLQQLRYLFIKAHTIRMTKHSLCSLYKLQTLILESNELNMLPQAFGKLINLRYLGIHCGSLKVLSKSICQLGNLVTLNIKYCHQLRELPLGISRLANLRHLILPNIQSFYLPGDIEKMAALQTLTHFCVRRDGQYSTIGRLKKLMNLQGKLRIFKLEEVANHEDARSANLLSMPHIERLKLCWRNIEDNECTKQNEAVLDGLQPHTNLKELTIDGYGGNSFPSWFSNPHFSNMTKVTLKNFFSIEECKILPLSGLSSLKSLHIRNIKGIKRLGHDFWCYTHLDGCENNPKEVYERFHTLKMKERPMMKNGDFWNLKYLHIYFCHHMELLSSLPSSLEELEVTCCKSLEHVALHDSSGPLSKLQKLTIYYCHNLKSVNSLNDLLATLKVLKLGVCYNLNQDEYSHHSLASVSLEDKVSVCVIGCPGMRKWCEWHGFTYEESSSIDGKILEERINKMDSKGDMYYREFPDDLYSEMLRLIRI